MNKKYLGVFVAIVVVIILVGLFYRSQKSFGDYVAELEKTHYVCEGGDWNRICPLLGYTYNQCVGFDHFVVRLEHCELVNDCSITVHADSHSKVLWFQMPSSSYWFVYVYL